MAHFLLAAIVLSSTSSQNPQSYCLWGRIGDNQWINGLWIYEDLLDGKPYYSKESCEGTYYLHWYDSLSRWQVPTSMGSSEAYAYCDTSSSLSDCNVWYIAAPNDKWSLDSSVTLLPDSCPSWPCDQIQIPSLSNDGCDILLDVHVDDNVWMNSNGTRYWYFTPESFDWACDGANNEYKKLCADESWFAYTKATEWKDVSIGETVSLQFEFPDTNSRTIHCIMSPTSSPTNDPTTAPTNDPTAPTNDQTTTPMNDPTLAPTITPTIEPTADPTFDPTLRPSIAPTILSPTAVLSFEIPCNEALSGVYNGDRLIFYVQTPYRATLTFDATDSTFIVTNIKAFVQLAQHETLLGENANDEAFLRLLDVSSGKYKFVIDGEYETSSIYDVSMYCEPNAYDDSLTTTLYLESLTPPTKANNSVQQSSKPWGITLTAILISIVTFLLCCFGCYLLFQKMKIHKMNIDINAMPIERKPSDDDHPIKNEMPLQDTELMMQQNTSMLFDKYVKSQKAVQNVIHTENEAQMMEDDIDVNDLMEIRKWLELKCDLPMYYEHFVQNGYESLEFVKDIRIESELKEIGITSKVHRDQILNSIKILRIELQKLQIGEIANDIDSDDAESVYSEGGEPKEDAQQINAQVASYDDNMTTIGPDDNEEIVTAGFNDQENIDHNNDSDEYTIK